MGQFHHILRFSFQTFYDQDTTQIYCFEMNSSRFFVFYISLFCSHYVANVQSANKQTLVFDVENNELMEIDEKNENAKCTHCITACAASSDSKEKQQMNKDAAIDGNATFLQKVYKNEDTKNIELDFCKEPLTPAIVYDTSTSSFEIGYEMFYDEENIELLEKEEKYWNFEKVIEGDRSPVWSTLPQTEHVKAKYNDANLKFNLLFDGSKQIFKYYWFRVLTIEIFPYVDVRQITFKKDAFNDFFHKNPTISHCNKYFIGGAWLAEESQKPHKDDSLMLEEQSDEKTTTQTPQQSDGNRLEKTQILPMQMFHTYSARLATCMYMNIAFIWGNVANGPLKEVDLLLYAMYRLWSNELTIGYVVQGEIQIDSDIHVIPSEPKFFKLYPVPEVIYRVVEWRHENELYKTIVIIHNEPDSVQNEDRICTNPIESWNFMKETTSPMIGFSYACPISTEVTSKLKLPDIITPKSLDLNSFPQIDTTSKKIFHSDVTQNIRNEIESLQGKNVQ